MLFAMIISSCDKDNSDQNIWNENEPNETFENATELKNATVFNANIAKGDKDIYLVHSNSNFDISVDCNNDIDFHITACDENHQNIWEHSSSVCNENHGHNSHSNNNGSNDHQENNHNMGSSHLEHSIHSTEHHGTCYLIIESTNDIKVDYSIRIDE